MSHYAELGLPNGASADQVKAAFRRLSMEWHPDRNKSADAEAKFKRISAAYTELTKGGRGSGSANNKTRPPGHHIFVVEVELTQVIYGFTFTGNDTNGRRIGRWQISPGVQDGQRIRLDINNEVQIRVRNDSVFRIDGQNIIYRTSLKKSQNRKGFKVRFELPEGGTKDTPLPRAVKAGEILVIENYGVPKYGSNFFPFYNDINRRGKLHIHFDIIDDTPWIIRKVKNLWSKL